MPLARSQATSQGAALGAAAKGRRAFLTLLLALLALGVGLRTVQYLAGVELWHDEAAVARNVADRDFAELVGRPLDHHQVAPAGFLALLATSTGLFGGGEIGFRFAPWLLGLASLVLFWRVARRFATGGPLLVGLAVFAVSPALVWYGSSVKPYGGDVAIGLALVWLALRHVERPEAMVRAVVAGLVGGVSLLLSFSAVPTAAVLGVLLVVAWWRATPRPPVVPLLALGAGWALGAAVAAWSALRLLDPATDGFMRDFWADDFPPSWSAPLAPLGWAVGKLYAVFAHSLVFIPPSSPLLRVIVGVPLALALVGLVFARRTPMRAALLLAPPAAGLLAAFIHLLPFDQRLGLHAAWPILVLATIGLAGLAGVLPGRWRHLATTLGVLMTVPLITFVLVVERPPYHGEVTRPVLTELARRHQPGDRIYVYTQGRHAMAFYGRREGLSDWIQGERNYDDQRGYLREVDALRGASRAWFFWVRLDRDEPALIRGYLEAIGHELERIAPGDDGATGAVLYDLSRPDRLAAAAAESFPLPEPARR